MIAIGIGLATLASFVASAALYAAPPVSTLISATSTPRAGIPVVAQMVAVVARSLIASCLFAGLMVAAGWHGAGAGLTLGLGLSVLPFVMLMGGVIHENTAVAAAGIHLLDWVVKFAIIGVIVGLFV